MMQLSITSLKIWKFQHFVKISRKQLCSWKTTFKRTGVWGENIFRIEECPDHIRGLFQTATAFSILRFMIVVHSDLSKQCNRNLCITPPVPAIEERCGELPFYYNLESLLSLMLCSIWLINHSQQEREERIRLAD
jgi:hypothetical protein